MKKLIVLTALASGFAFGTVAQENNGKAAKQEKTEKESPKKEKEKSENPPMEQRQNAEEKSNGNAFSGKGEGGDKNMTEPQKKPKKAKKPKKEKKAKKEKM